MMVELDIELQGYKQLLKRKIPKVESEIDNPFSDLPGILKVTPLMQLKMESLERKNNN